VRERAIVADDKERTATMEAQQIGYGLINGHGHLDEKRATQVSGKCSAWPRGSSLRFSYCKHSTPVRRTPIAARYR
jgi:hypothetical protein